jgi:hypothetical protein
MAATDLNRDTSDRSVIERIDALLANAYVACGCMNAINDQTRSRKLRATWPVAVRRASIDCRCRAEYFWSGINRVYPNAAEPMHTLSACFAYK